jgi:hypothetical protein
VNVLESKVSDLEKVVEQMSNTFLDFSDDLLESRQVDPEKIKKTMAVFLALSNRASRALDDEGGASEDEQDIRGDQSSSSKAISNAKIETSQKGDLEGPLIYSSFEELPTSLSQRNKPLSAVSGDPDTIGFRVSDPYRNYLWGSPQNSSTDGTSALPYILAGRDSFASRLYFETIVMAVRALQGEGSGNILDSMYRYKRRYANFDHILGVTSGVLNMMLHGTSQDPKENPKAVRFSELDGPQESAMKAAIAQEVVMHGSSETEYLNTWNVERYLRDKWGLGVDSTIVRTPLRALEAHSDHFSSAVDVAQSASGNPIPFAPTMVPGFAHSEQSLFDTQSLVERIMLGAVSLGEGPRWHVSFVDNAVQSFLQHHSSKLGIPTY